MDFKFCPFCAHPLEKMKSDGKKRLYCAGCDKKHYLNPTVGVAVILLVNDRLLLVKRGKGISYEDKWCIPCGHVEWGEDVREAGQREFLEETGLEIKIGPVFEVHSNFHDPLHLTVGIWFCGTCTGGKLAPGSDAQDVRFFPLDLIPEEMAFPTDLLVVEKLKRVVELGKPRALDVFPRDIRWSHQNKK
jgi:ADP-ribose pyrophosphatase YjhB (NUDIX family)